MRTELTAKKIQQIMEFDVDQFCSTSNSDKVSCMFERVEDLIHNRSNADTLRRMPDLEQWLYEISDRLYLALHPMTFSK